MGIFSYQLDSDCIIIRPKATPRNGWDAAFKEIYQNNDDELLIADVFENENFEEWNLSMQFNPNRAMV